MCRCIKFAVFCQNVNQMYKSSYILNVHEDDEMIYMLRFLHKCFLLCFQIMKFSLSFHKGHKGVQGIEGMFVF
jgi:hypothetical protein